jgi:hypothetical protein
MTKTFSYLVFLVVLATIAASAAITGIYYAADIDDDNKNNDNTGLFPVAHAQSSSSSSPKKATVILNLNNKRENMFSKGMIEYDITNISSNDTRLQGATLAEGGSPYVAISSSSLNIHFTLHIPNATNPNIMGVKDVYMFLNVDSIETMPDDNKIYYSKSDLSNKIADNVEISEGRLI